MTISIVPRNQTLFQVVHLISSQALLNRWKENKFRLISMTVHQGTRERKVMLLRPQVQLTLLEATTVKFIILLKILLKARILLAALDYRRELYLAARQRL